MALCDTLCAVSSKSRAVSDILLTMFKAMMDREDAGYTMLGNGDPICDPNSTARLARCLTECTRVRMSMQIAPANLQLASILIFAALKRQQAPHLQSNLEGKDAGRVPNTVAL